MKVLIVNHFPLSGSGSGTYTKNIAVYLQKAGYDVCVIFPENSMMYEKIENVRMHPIYFKGDKEINAGQVLPFNFPCFTTHPRSRKTFGSLTKQELKQYMKAFESAIQKEIVEFKPDIIHGQHIWLLSELICKQGLPNVITAHGTDLMGFQKWASFQKSAKEAALSTDGIVAISKDTEQQVLELFPEVKHKVRVIANGYDANIFYPEKTDREKVLAKFGIENKGQYIVSFVGKLTYFKGIDVLLKAASIYERVLKGNVLTLIVGSGELEEPLKQQQEQLNVKNVYFLGHASQNELRSIYNIADVSTVPSRREPFGLVAVEALACGTPVVVVTAEGGLAEIVNETVGSCVETENAEQLSIAILKELRYEKKEKRRKAATSYALEHYSQEQSTKELIQFYESIINQYNKEG